MVWFCIYILALKLFRMNRILTFLAVLIFSAGISYAQDTTADDLSLWANEWKYAFSKEGVKEWKPEFTLRYYTGLITTGPMLTSWQT